MSNFPVGALLPLGIISIILIAFVVIVVIPDWRKSRQTKAVEKAPAPPTKPKIFVNRRWGVRTAYLKADLADCYGDLIMPHPGIMIFTDDVELPRTGGFVDLEDFAAATGHEIVGCSEYAFHTVGRSALNFAEDVRSHGHLVLTWDQAVERAKSHRTA